MGLKAKAIILIISAAAVMSVGCGKKEDYGVPQVSQQNQLIQQQQAQIQALQSQLQTQSANVNPQYNQPQVIVQQVPVPQQSTQQHDSGPGVGSMILGTAVGSAIGTVAGNAVSSAIAERKNGQTIVNQYPAPVAPERKSSWFTQRSDVQKPVDSFKKPATVGSVAAPTPKPAGSFWSSAGKSTSSSGFSSSSSSRSSSGFSSSSSFSSSRSSGRR